MPEFSSKSRNILDTCHPGLRKLFNEVIKHFDCTVVSGRRGEQEQEQLFAEGKTKAHFGDSPHNYGESLAVDVVPYPVKWDGEQDVLRLVRNGQHAEALAALHNLERMVYFAGQVKGIATMMGIDITWGGDWNRDTHLSDNRFDDMPHFELVGWRKIAGKE